MDNLIHFLYEYPLLSLNIATHLVYFVIFFVYHSIVTQRALIKFSEVIQQTSNIKECYVPSHQPLIVETIERTCAGC